MYNLNIEKVISDTGIPLCIRSFFLRLKEKQYITPGEFLSFLSDEDIDYLNKLAEDMIQDGESGDRASYMIGLVALSFLHGEGETMFEVDLFEDAIKSTVLFVTLESLFRKGLIKVYRENWTIDLSDNRILAENIGE